MLTTDSSPTPDASTQGSDRRSGGFSTCTRTRILLAEDDREMRSMLAYVLRQAGCDVIEARDGVELTKTINDIAFAMLEGANELAVDLIISDIHMPGWTGMEVLARIRRAHLNTPVILMTAFGDMRTREEARRLGAEVVLNKPFPIADLLAAVRAVPSTRTS